MLLFGFYFLCFCFFLEWIWFFCSFFLLNFFIIFMVLVDFLGIGATFRSLKEVNKQFYDIDSSYTVWLKNWNQMFLQSWQSSSVLTAGSCLDSLQMLFVVLHGFIHPLLWENVEYPLPLLPGVTLPACLRPFSHICQDNPSGESRSAWQDPVTKAFCAGWTQHNRYWWSPE